MSVAWLRRNLSPRMYTWLYRHGLNFWPCIRGTGGRVTHIAENFSEIIVQLKFNWRTKNRIGTIFGGSMYGSTDPMYMLMLMEILGQDYVVWDKGCTIQFKRPAKVHLTARFHITSEMLAKVREDVSREGETTFTWTVDYKDKDGLVYATFEKVLYAADKQFYKEKLKRKTATKRG